MGNFSIVFKNSLQNKKQHPASSCIATRDRAFRRLAFHDWSATQPETERTILASARIVATASKAPFLAEGYLEEFEASTFRQGSRTLRQSRPSVLCNVQDVALGQLDADPVWLHLEAQNVGHHFCSVHVADGRLNVCRDLTRVDLLHPNDVHCLQGQHAQGKCVYENVHNTLSFSRASQFGGLTEFHKKNFRTIYIIPYFT